MCLPKMARSLWILALLFCSLLLVAANAQSPKRPFFTALESWESTIQQYEIQFSGRGLSEQQRKRLAEIEQEAIDFRSDARSRIEYFDQLLNALGDVPEEGEPEEPQAVKSKREALQAEKDDYLTREKFSTLAIERIHILNDTKVADQQNDRIKSLWLQRDSLLNIYTWPKVGANLFASESSPEDVSPWGAFVTAGWFVVQAVLYCFSFFVVHRFFIGYFNRLESQHTDKAVSIWYKLSTRLANVVINLFLAISLWVLMVWFAKLIGWPNFAMPIQSMPLIQTVFTEKAVKQPFGMNLVLYSVLCYVAIRAVLAPRNTWWGLISIQRPNARLLVRSIPQLMLLSLMLFYIHEKMELANFTEATVSLVMTLGLSLFAYRLNRTRKKFLHGLQGAPDESPPVSGADHEYHQWLHNLLNRLLFLSGLIIVAAAVFGYQNLSVRIAISMAFTALVTLIFLAVRTVVNVLLEELTYYLQREERPNLIAEKASDKPLDTDSGQGQSSDMSVMIAKVVVNLVLLAAFFGSIALLWGYPVEQLNIVMNKVLTGIDVGGKTISLQKIGLGLAFLFVGIAAASSLNRMVVRSDLLSKTTSEGVRYSIGTILKYIFIVITFLFSISLMGLDLSTLGFFAGALGIGIGFGLQSIVQNFVSGLILLIQRPMEIGDWVEIGSSTGVVKKINLMNTEIETFERAILIFPNSDVMSATFINKTRGNKQGRIEISIGVAYGSDTQQVEKILKDIAHKHPKVMKYQPIMVLFQEFADSSLNFELRFFIYDVFNSLSVASDIRYQIDEAFKEAGIEIPFPQRVVHLQNSVDDVDGVDGVEDSQHEETGVLPKAPKVTQSISSNDPIKAMPDE